MRRIALILFGTACAVPVFLLLQPRPQTVTAQGFVSGKKTPMPAVSPAATQVTAVVVVASTATPTLPPTATPVTPTPNVGSSGPIQVSAFEPALVAAGQSAQLSVFGVNFGNNCTVRILGFGLLATTYVDAGALTATVPGSVPPGQYSIEVLDGNGRQSIAPGVFMVLPPTPLQPTAAPPPTATTIPTPIPGQPSLFVRSFTVTPEVVAPGQTVTLDFDVYNQGNYPAHTISASVDAGGSFLPANGQEGITLPDLPPGASTMAELSAMVVTTTAGPTVVPVTLTYLDNDAHSYTSKAIMTVTVRTVLRAAKVQMAAYSVNPNPAQPGTTVHLKAQLANVGNQAAYQVQVKVPATSGLLLPGAKGDTIFAGTLKAASQTSLDVPLVLAAEAKAGYQTEPISIDFLDDGKPVEVQTSFTINVAHAAPNDPLLVLDSYDTGSTALKPGDKFHLKANLKNIGKGPAQGLIVFFGGSFSNTITEGDPNQPQQPQPIVQQQNAQNGNFFAPVSNGGTAMVGNVAGGGTKVTVEQDIIVNGQIMSGVYSLPMTLRYQREDGAIQISTVSASIVIFLPAQVEMTLQSPMPAALNVDQPQSMAIQITNAGRGRVNLSTIQFSTDNGSFRQGAETPLRPLDPNQPAAAAAVFSLASQGPATITVTLHYLDDLNQDQTIVKTYKVQGIIPPPPPTLMPVVSAPTQPPPPSPSNMFQRVLFGFLGLGS